MKNIGLSVKQDMRKNLTEKYPCYFIPRKKIADASNGILNPRTMAAEDYSGKGIANPIIIKGNVCYGIDEILDYIFKSSLSVGKENGGGHD